MSTTVTSVVPTSPHHLRRGIPGTWRTLPRLYPGPGCAVRDGAVASESDHQL